MFLRGNSLMVEQQTFMLDIPVRIRFPFHNRMCNISFFIVFLPVRENRWVKLRFILLREVSLFFLSLLESLIGDGYKEGYYFLDNNYNPIYAL